MGQKQSELKVQKATEDLKGLTATNNEAITSISLLKSELDNMKRKSESLELTLLEVTADTLASTDAMKLSLKRAEEKIIELEEYCHFYLDHEPQ